MAQLPEADPNTPLSFTKCFQRLNDLSASTEETGKKIDQEISKIIEAQYARAIEILDDNKDKLTVLAELLLEKEVIFKDDLEKIFGKRPFDVVAEEVTTIEKVEAKDEVENKEEVETPIIDKTSEE